MALPESSRAPEPRVVGYRFAGVALDLRRGSLSIDGNDVGATPLLLQLLQILCESEGRLLTRQELFDALWPGGQTVSDSALSQLIWRLRSLLGPYGSLVTTLRRSGVRLEAPVSTEFDFQRSPRKALPEPSGAEPSAAPVPPAVEQAGPLPPGPPQPAGDAAAPRAKDAAVPQPVASPGGPAAPRRRVLAAVLVLAALAAGLAAWLLRDPLIFDGYALRESDLQADRRETAGIARAAFAAEEAGDRERAIALMRSLHASDLATPVPAAMLAWWRSHTAPEEAAAWGRAARARLRPDTPPYLRLFVDYFVTRSGNDSYRGALNAALELRPAAWRMQYARAHVLLADRDFAGALRSLQQVPTRGPEAGLLADVLADRLSLGDPAVAAMARALPAIAGNPTLRTYLQGREAYSAGRLAEAVAALDESARHAQQAGDYLRQIMATELAGIAAFEAASADTLPRLSATRRLCQDRGRFDCVATALGLQAVMEARRGEAGRASALLAEAWQLAPHLWMRPALLLVALENQLALPGDLRAVAADIADDPAFAGVAELLRGWQAQARGQPEQARRELDLAVERGVRQTYSAEDALLLAARLGAPVAPCRTDPPYPNPLRLSACLQLREKK
ncbi:winged helix-turn-helix domain-containing protein [Tahibacter harae]|uniref:Winged helix-turn-helix domain-containing protein n=1 Tax=Tahibacter harae TaxID=2963937 RepID=A0ABT1QU96_9GAMM|nr:winged helix-turn-helix domain-containing protein [Tahibacter harae]MCQ4165843.1 winged helix-turn-helix domain-containing protein [Tahibacter harae]